MTNYEKNVSLLKAFGIPKGWDDNATQDVKDVGNILARLLAARSLRLAQLQTARDIYERAGLDEPRLYLFLAALFISAGQGNAYMNADKVEELLVNGGYLDDAEKMGCESNEDYKDKHLSPLVKDVDWNQLARSFDGDILVYEDGKWYFQRNRVSLDDLNKKLSAFVTANKELEEVGDKILEHAADFKDFSLNAEQKEALKAAVCNRFTVITGGPGTGKTTTVCAILRALLEVHKDWTEKDIALAAPTGRAAQRMSEAILDQCAALKEDPQDEQQGEGQEKRRQERLIALDKDKSSIADRLEGSTIHRLLGGYAPNWKHDAKNPLEHKVVIVDETSMVDLYLMHALLQALKPEARLILLGDADQLPSVDTGAVLGDLTALGMGDGFVKRLEVCERAKGEVSEVAQKINNLARDGAKAQEGANALVTGWKQNQIHDIDQLFCANQVAAGGSVFQWLCPPDDIKKEAIQSFYSKWMSGNKLVAMAGAIDKTDKCLAGESSGASKALFAELNRRKILTLVREGWYGVKEANAFLLKEVKNAAKTSGDYLSMVGVPIMVTHNTPERKLFNGDVGVTVKGPHGMVVLFPRGKKTIACPVALLPEHELAYAMTVHKSQGSEFENVMVVLPNDENHPLLNRQIVYTGITRAKKRAVVVGTSDVLKTALSRRLVRNTGLSLKKV